MKPTAQEGAEITCHFGVVCIDIDSAHCEAFACAQSDPQLRGRSDEAAPAAMAGVAKGAKSEKLGNRIRCQCGVVCSLASDFRAFEEGLAQAATAALPQTFCQFSGDLKQHVEIGAGPHSSPEVLRAWRRRQDECCRQLPQDHYETLGLPPLAEPEEVRRAYRDLARRWHPDKHQSRSLDLRDRAAQRFTRIRHAYEVLSDEGLKQSYDTQLRHEARPMASRGLGSHPNEPESKCFDQSVDQAELEHGCDCCFFWSELGQKPVFLSLVVLSGFAGPQRIKHHGASRGADAMLCMCCVPEPGADATEILPTGDEGRTAMKIEEPPGMVVEIPMKEPEPIKEEIPVKAAPPEVKELDAVWYEFNTKATKKGGKVGCKIDTLAKDYCILRRLEPGCVLRDVECMDRVLRVNGVGGTSPALARSMAESAETFELSIQRPKKIEITVDKKTRDGMKLAEQDTCGLVITDISGAFESIARDAKVKLFDRIVAIDGTLSTADELRLLLSKRDKVVLTICCYN
eukprot:s1533_g4.t1